MLFPTLVLTGLLCLDSPTTQVAPEPVSEADPQIFQTRALIVRRSEQATTYEQPLRVGQLHPLSQRVGHNLRWSGRTALGSERLTIDRALDEQASEALLETLRADPDVVYADADWPIYPAENEPARIGPTPLGVATPPLLQGSDVSGQVGPWIKSTDASQQHFPWAAPDDQLYASQWHYAANRSGVNLRQAWPLSLGRDVQIGVIDSGYTEHPDLNANLILPGFDFITMANDGDGSSGRDADARDPGSGMPAEYCPGDTGPQTRPWPSKDLPSSWHGTHVAGTIAAVTNNRIGVAGVAPKSRVMPIRVLGRCHTGRVSDLADAIVWAAGGQVENAPAHDQNLRILNLSLGQPLPHNHCNAELEAAIAFAESKGVLTVVAANNWAHDAAFATPSNCSRALVVAAHDHGGQAAVYSDRGVTVDLAAPGGSGRNEDPEQVLSLVNTGAIDPDEPGYGYRSGTSMATPHVSGVAALMLAANPALEVEQLKAGLKRATHPIGGECPERGCGHGRLDARAAIDAARGRLLNNGEYRNLLGEYAAHTRQRFSVIVPPGAHKLRARLVPLDGSKGSAELLLRRGQQPNLIEQDCRVSSDETDGCFAESPEPGLYQMLVYSRHGFENLSLQVEFVGGQAMTFSNPAPVTIPDPSEGLVLPVTSEVVVHRRGPARLVHVGVDILHDYVGDLRLQLIAPNGERFLLHDRTGESDDNLRQFYTVELNGLATQGRWQLWAADYRALDRGRIEDVKLTFMD